MYIYCKALTSSLFLLILINAIFCDICKTELKENGKFIIVGMFPIQSCKAPNFDSIVILKMEAFRYAVKKANYINDDIFGYIIYDTGNNTNFDVTTKAIVNTLIPNDGQNTCNCSNENIVSQNILGIVGPQQSQNSIYIHQVISPFYNISILSYSATSVELNDKLLYPNFFRTIPPDNYQAEAITNLMVSFNWTYVSLLASDNTYGRTGAQVLIENFQKRGICISVQSYFSDNYNSSVEEYNGIVTNLNQSTSKVIIMWGYLDSIEAFLKIASKNGLSGKTWVISESNQMDPLFNDLLKILNGTIILALPVLGGNNDFEEYFLNLTYGESDHWLKMIFEKFNESQPNTQVRELDYKFNFILAKTVQVAVDALINAFKNYRQEKFIVDLVGNREDFNKEIKQVNISMGKNISFRFDENQNPRNARYDFYFVSGSKFIDFAYWSSEENFIIINQTTFHLIAVNSSCSEPCPEGKYPEYYQEKCCWTCTVCPENQVKNVSGKTNCTLCHPDEYPNLGNTKCLRPDRIYWSFVRKEKPAFLLVVFFTSVFGVLTAIVFMLTFIHKKSTPIVRSANFRMSMLQMTTHLILFLVPFLFFGEDSKWKCYIRTYASGLLSFTIITLTLVKVNHLVAVFGSHHQLTQKDKMKMNMKELLIFLCALSSYVTMIFVMQSIYPLNLTEDKKTTSSSIQIEKHCDTLPFLVSDISLTLIILFLCAVQSFHGRNLPGKYNDANYIAFGMFSSTLVKIIAIPIGVGLRDSNNYTLLIWFATNISNFLLLTILYFYKIKIIIFNPSKNTTEVFRRTSFESIRSSDSNNTTSACTNPAFEVSTNDEKK